MQRSILQITAPDEKGLVARITGVLHRHDCNVVENGEFVDSEQHRFFMRTAFDGGDTALIGAVLKAELPKASRIVLRSAQRKRILLMATREPHCLGDLLIRADFQDIPAVVSSVISNHGTLRKLTESFGIPFHEIPVAGLSREAHEAQVRQVIEAENPDLVVMAKYMRVLTPGFIAAYPERILNIHHSFLPAFVGANPYRQAYERGVKIIGATAHYATEVLDEGPIIAQDVVPVTHASSPQEMARSGRDVEKRVLARALRYVLEDRVFVTGNKTIIFE